MTTVDITRLRHLTSLISDFAYCNTLLSVCLSVTFVHCAQMAEDIDTISFAYNSPLC